MSIGSFTLIKNEAPWIAAHLLSWLPHLNEMVFYDGNSTDGTLEIIEAIRKENGHGHKIMLFKGKDPADLKDSYTCMFDECLHSLSTDLAVFLHPDMIASKVPDLPNISECIAASCKVRSFGGEPGKELYEIHGRCDAWKNIYRLRNPDLGCHYYGAYGAWNEDCYFRAITGDQHILYEDFSSLPYGVEDSGIELLHFSDVRPYERRVNRMYQCLMNNNGDPAKADKISRTHPRVTFKDGGQYTFTPAAYPEQYVKDRGAYQHLERSALVNA